MVTIGEDQIMCMFDLTLNKLIKIVYLKLTPTVVKFSPDGDILVIGFINGDLRLYDSKMKKNTFGKLQDRYELPSLKYLMNLKEKVKKKKFFSF
jgi:hypothetical protein